MMDFSTILATAIPQGEVTQIADASGNVLWSAAPKITITYNANGGSGSMGTQEVILSLSTTVSANAFSRTGYRFTGWNTAANGSGTAYSAGQSITPSSNITLYAQWSIIYYNVVYRHSYDSDFHTSDDTGPMECYALYINGTEQSDLGSFSNNSRTLSLPYGTKIKVVAEVDSGDDRSYVTWNGTKVAGNSSSASYEFTLTTNTDIHMEWNYFLSSSFKAQSYWNCYITTT